MKNLDSIAFDVGTNFDYKIFDIIKDADKKHSIRSLYGKLKNDGLPGGRAASTIPDFSMDQLADFVAECKENDLTFNYLINPLSLDQMEIDPIIVNKIHTFLHDAYDIGIRAFTINSPILIKYMKREFKDIFITLGLYAYPENIQHIEYWRSWGVDEITLDHSFNRNFDLLRKVLTQYKDTDLHLRAIANNLCVRECPFRMAHGSFTGHSDPNATSMDYILVNCAYRKVNTPSAILSSEWIRPEDIHYYRELAEETGNKNFSLKLVDRTRTTPFIERVIRAYMSESFEGNLLEILNWPEAKNIANIPGTTPANAGKPANIPPMGMPAGGPPSGVAAGGPPPGVPIMRHMDKLKPEAIMAYGRAMNFPKIKVDNRKLDGFLDHFIKNYNCDNMLCSNNIIEKGEKNLLACSHCSAWADKAISYDKAEVEQWKAITSQVLQGIEDGSIYKEQ